MGAVCAIKSAQNFFEQRKGTNSRYQRLLMIEKKAHIIKNKR